MQFHNNLNQGTDEWFALKKNFPMSSSNAGACMGFGYPDCKNVEDLAKIHLGLRERHFPDFLQKRMQIGLDLEPVIRQKVENKLNESFKPKVITNGDYLLSSDGINLEKTINLEIKTTGEKTKCFAGAKTGEIIETHKWQLDHALLVTGFEKCVYAVFCDTNEELVIQEYYRDEKRIKSLRDGWNRFQDLIADPSQLTTEEKIPAKFDFKIKAFFDAKDAKEKAEKDFKILKSELLKEFPANCVWENDNLKIGLVNPSKPKIDYQALVENNLDKLQEVDFEFYRKSTGKMTQRFMDKRK